MMAGRKLEGDHMLSLTAVGLVCIEPTPSVEPMSPPQGGTAKQQLRARIGAESVFQTQSVSPASRKEGFKWKAVALEQ